MPDGWPAGIGLRRLDEVDSTNSEASRIVAGLGGPCWVHAAVQTAARGRRSRPWIAPRGNFYGTLVYRPEGPSERAALRSFVAALALRDALDGLTGAGAALGLKWPNDVLLSGGKMAGILLESFGTGRGVSHLAVGIGVNLIACPDPADVEPGALRPVTVLGETGQRIAPEALLLVLARAYALREAQLVTEGFAPIRADWLRHAVRLGEPILARTGTTERRGIFETIDESGALILLGPQGREAVAAADVFF